MPLGHVGYWALIAPALVLMALCYLVPVALVLWISVTEPTPGLANYALLFSSASVQAVLWTTFRLCLVTTLVTSALAYGFSYALVHAQPRVRAILMACVLLPLWISALVRAFAWITLLRGEGIINTALLAGGLIDHPVSLVRNELGVIIGMVHVMLPFGILPLYANMRGIDQTLIATARGLGASSWQSFRRVFLPLSVPGLAASVLLVFIFSLGFFTTPAILGGGKVMMVAEYIGVQMTETLRWGLGAMLSATLLLAVLLAIMVLSFFTDLRKAFGAA